jgi:hypothetical protein
MRMYQGKGETFIGLVQIDGQLFTRNGNIDVVFIFRYGTSIV